MTESLLTAKEAAAYLNVSLRTLYNLSIRRIKIGRCTRFDPTDLRLYVALHADRPSLTNPNAARPPTLRAVADK